MYTCTFQKCYFHHATSNLQYICIHIQRHILLCHFNFNSTISSSSSYNFPTKALLYYYFVALLLHTNTHLYISIFSIFLYIVFMCTQYIFFLLQFHKICNPFSATALKHNNNGFVNYLYNRNLKTRDFRWNF